MRRINDKDSGSFYSLLSLGSVRKETEPAVPGTQTLTFPMHCGLGCSGTNLSMAPLAQSLSSEGISFSAPLRPYRSWEKKTQAGTSSSNRPRFTPFVSMSLVQFLHRLGEAHSALVTSRRNPQTQRTHKQQDSLEVGQGGIQSAR